MISTNKDRKGKEFVSTAESKHYPIYATQVGWASFFSGLLVCVSVYLCWAFSVPSTFVGSAS